MPRAAAFADLEDGGVGYNFATLGNAKSAEGQRLIAAIAEAARAVTQLRTD